MIWVRLTPLMALAVPMGLHAQLPPDVIPPVDDSVYALAVDPGDYPGQDYVLLLDDGLAVIEADGRASYTLRQVAQVLTSDGAAMLGEFAFAYTPGRQNLRINWMRVITDGTLQQDGPEHQVESDAGTFPGVPVYSERKIVQATLAGVAPGVLIDFSYTIETYSPRLAGDVLYDWAVNFDAPVVRSRFVLDAPADLALRVEERNLNIAPDTTTVAGRRALAWQVEDIPAVELERFAGFPNEVLMSIRVGGAISWDDIGAWYAELLRGRFEVNDELVGAFARVIEGARTLDDSLKTLYRWVAEDYRYVALALGDGGYQPRVPLDVYRTRFGDCKDKTTLFIALARKMGLDAYPVLVSSAGAVDSLLPSVKQFDHMIAALERGGSVEFLDLTAWLMPYGELPPELQGTVGLMIRDDGAAHIVVLPASDPASNRLEQKIVGAVRSDGTFVGSVTVSATGTEQHQLRASFLDFRQLTESDQHDILQEWGGTWDTAVIDSSRVSGGRDLAANAQMTIWITAPRAVSSSGDHHMMSLPLAALGSAALVTSLESAGERRFPIDIAMVNSPSVYRNSFEVTLPEGWRVRVPEDVRVDGPFGHYQGEYEQVGSHFRASREMGGLRGLLPPDSAGALIAWVRDVSEDGTEYIIIDRSDGPALGASAIVPDTTGDLSRLLPVAGDLGTGVALVAEGPAAEGEFRWTTDVLALGSWQREFAAEQMVFSLGSSQIVGLEMSVTEFSSRAAAGRTQRIFDVVDVPTLLQVSLEQEAPGQVTIGEARPMDLASLGDGARGWTLEFVTPLSTMDVAFLSLTRGRVSVSVWVMGARGIRTEDVERLAVMVDERISQNEAYLTDLERDAHAVAPESESEGPTVADRAGGVALDQLLPGPEDFQGSIISGENLTQINGLPVYGRDIDGRDLTFAIGGSEVIRMTLDVTLHRSTLQAMKAILRLEDMSPMARVLDGLVFNELAEGYIRYADTSYRKLDVPAVGSRAAGAAAEARGAVNLDIAGISFASGRLVASVFLVTLPGELDSTVLSSIAEDIHQRMRRVAPEIAARVPGEISREMAERVIAQQQEVDSLLSERMIDSAFAAVEQVDFAGLPVTLEAYTWNNVCWYGSLYGYAERAMPACEAAVAPDTTNVNIRDSRGLARALVGDTQGAIEDFRYVVEHAPQGEMLETRKPWLEALLAGEDPFTEPVLQALREQ